MNEFNTVRWSDNRSTTPVLVSCVYEQTHTEQCVMLLLHTYKQATVSCLIDTLQRVLTVCVLTACVLTACVLTACLLTACVLTACLLTACVLTVCLFTACAFTACVDRVY